MAKKHVFWVKGSYEKRSLEEQGDLSLKVMGKKFGSCSSKYDVLYFPVLRPPFISTSPMINFQSIFQPPSRPPPFKFGIIKYSFEETKIPKLIIFHPTLFFRFVIAGEYIFMNMNSSCWGIIFRNVFTKVDILKTWQLNICHGVILKSTAVAKILKEDFFVW